MACAQNQSPEQFGIGERALASAADIFDKGFGAIGGLSQSFYGLLQLGSEAIGADTIAEYAADKALIGSELTATLSANLANIGEDDANKRVRNFELAQYIQNKMNQARIDVAGISLGDIGGAAVSLAPTLVGGLGVQGLSRINQMRVFGGIAALQQGGATFADQRQQGKDFGESLKQTTLSAAITGLLTRTIPGGPETAIDDFGKLLAKSKNPKAMLRNNMVRAVGVQFFSEFLEEGLDETLQAILVDGSSWEEAIERGLKAGTIGGILGGSFGLSVELSGRHLERNRQAIAHYDNINAVKEQADQSTTIARSKEAGKEFLQNHGDVNQTNYIDAVIAEEIAASKEGAQTLSKLGIDQQDIINAKKNGEVLEVDVASLVVHAQGNVFERISENLRQDIDAPSAIEARALDSRETESLIARQDEDIAGTNRKAFDAEFKRIRDEIIEATGQTKDQANNTAQVIASGAWSLWTRNRNAFASPEALLQKISVQRGDAPEGSQEIARAQNIPAGYRLSKRLDKKDRASYVLNGKSYKTVDAALAQLDKRIGKASRKVAAINDSINQIRTALKKAGISYEKNRKSNATLANGWRIADQSLQDDIAGNEIIITESLTDEQLQDIVDQIKENPEANIFHETQPDAVVGAEELGNSFSDVHEFFQAAFHGTPHQFDKFTLDAIGTGEGAQAFGWGLYFTSEESIAEYYRNALVQQRNPLRLNGKDRFELASTVEGVIYNRVSGYVNAGLTLGKAIQRVEKEGDDPQFNFSREQVENIRDGFTVDQGDLKTVDLPESSDLLQWDKPLSEQTESVQSGVRKLSDDFGIEIVGDANGKQVYDQIRADIKGEGLQGDRGIDQAVSETLGLVGIPGLEYPAGTIAGTESDGRNFVIWQEDAIKIIDPEKGLTKKYYQDLGTNAPRGSVKIVDDQYIINLFQGQDLTTVLHEAGHIFLEEISQAIAAGVGSDDLITDWMTLSKWQADSKDNHLHYLREQLSKSGDNARTAKLQTAINWIEQVSAAEFEQAAVQFAHNLDSDLSAGVAETMHELFARGMELYLSEGKAPSIGLEKAFHRFAQWIANIYSKIIGSFNGSDALNVELDDDVRKVFNRILATEAEIQQLALVNEYTGRGDVEFGEIPNFDAEATGRINKLFAKSRDEIARNVLRDRSKAAFAARKSFRADLEAEPLYAAWSSIREQGGLRHAQVQTLFGQDTVNALREKGLIAKTEDTGAIPDDVAYRYGYVDNTGDADAEALILDLLDARAPQAELQARLDDAVLRSELAEPTLEAVLESPAFNKAIDTMSRALNKAVRGNLPMEERRVIRDAAVREMSGKQMYAATLVNKYLQEMNRHLKANRRQLARGEFEEAMQSLHHAVVAQERARAAKDMRKMQEQALNKAKRIKRADKKNIDYSHWYYAVKTAERFGMLPVDPSIPAPDMSLLELLQHSQDAQLNDIDPLPDFERWLFGGEIADRKLAELQNELERQRPQHSQQRGPRSVYQAMPANEFEQLHNFIQFLEGRGRDKADPALLTTGEKTSDWKDRAFLAMGTVNDKGVVKVDASSIRGKFTERVRQFGSKFMATDFYYRTLDNNEKGATFKDFDPSKPWAQVAMIEGTKAESARTERRREVLDILAPHMDVLGQAVKRLGKNVDTGVPVPQRMIDANYKTWDGSRIIGMLMNIGNEYNLQATAAGMGWYIENHTEGEPDTEPDVQKVLSFTRFLTETELQALQGIWDGINTMWADSRRAHLQLYNFPPNKVEADPVSVISSEGKTITLPGGYYPLKFDARDKQSVHATQEDTSDLNFNYGGTFAPSKLQRNNLIERQGSGGKMVNLDAARAINEHIDNTTTFIHMGSWLRDMRKIFNDREVLPLVRKKLGDEGTGQLLSNLRAIAGNERQDLNEIDKFMNDTKAKAGLFLLGGNYIRGALAVSDAIPRLMSDVGIGNYLKHLSFFRNNEGITRWQFALENSVFIRERLRGAWDRDAKQLVQENLKLDQYAWYRNAKNKVTDIAMAGYAYPGLFFEVPAWTAIYEKTMNETGKHEDAVAAADLAIRSTQPSSSTRDLSMIQRSKKSVANMMLMFSGWAVTALNNNRYMARQLAEGNVTPGQYMGYFFMQNVVSTFPFALMGLLFAGGNDDDEGIQGVTKDVFRGIAVDSFRGLPLISNIAAAGFDLAVDGKPLNQSFRNISSLPGASIYFGYMAKGLTGMYEVFDSDKREQAIWNIAHMVSLQTGIPASRFMESVLRTDD